MGDRISKEIFELKMEIRALHNTIREYLVYKTTGKTTEQIEEEIKAEETLRETLKSIDNYRKAVKKNDELPTSEDGGDSV